jgi:ribosome-associated toxin RatA of RatAB toxin-antitoxin module
MIHLKKNLLLNHSAKNMFDLVHQTEKYPEFLPWCGSILDLGASTAPLNNACCPHKRTKVNIDYHGVKLFFATENHHFYDMDKHEYFIHMNFIDGPFKKFDGRWFLTQLKHSESANACKVRFELDYEFSNGLLDRVISPVFNILTGTFVERFVERADAIYGVEEF